MNKALVWEHLQFWLGEMAMSEWNNYFIHHEFCAAGVMNLEMALFLVRSARTEINIAIVAEMYKLA